MKQYYDVLGIPENSSQEDIRKAYKACARTYHPDNQETGNEEKFKQVQESFEILTGKRKPPGPQFDEQPFNPFNMGFDFSGFSGFDFGGFGRNQANENRPPESDEGVNLELRLNMQEIKAGKVYNVKYQKSRKCNECNGVGGKQKLACDTCRGQGQVQKVFQQGPIHMRQIVTCPACAGRGMKVKDPCVRCGSNGFTVYEEAVSFEIKEKK